MFPSEERHNREVCKNKTAKRNVFDNEAEARLAAKTIDIGSRRSVIAFQCTVCGKWHIGSQGVKPEYADLRLPPEEKNHPPTKIGTSLRDVLAAYRQ